MSDIANKRQGGRKKAKIGRGPVLFWLVAAMPVALILWPSLLLATPLMLPTLLSFVVEWRRAKHMTQSVGSLNAVGTLPTLVQLWEGGHTAHQSVILLSDPINWAIAVAAAGFGYLVHMSTEWVVGAYYRISVADRMRRISGKQRELMELWGPEVETPDASRLMTESEVSEGSDDDGADRVEAA